MNWKRYFPDKFADKEVLNELEVAFCNKKGIYNVGYNDVTSFFTD